MFSTYIHVFIYQKSVDSYLCILVPPQVQLTISASEMQAAPGVHADAKTLLLARVNSQAGACLAIGLRFAGSCCKPAHELLLAQVKHFHGIRQGVGGRGGATKSEQPTIETCLGAAAIALACVMAGSGNLGVLRMLRVLRRRADGDVTYGFHMAISMAIGLLFLGGGRLTLGTSKPALAALVAAIFPRFPLTPTDNRYHLQAFRHLYVLAAEARCLEAIDVDTGEPAMVPLTVTLRGKEQRELHHVTPCQLPQLNMLHSLETESPRYWQRSLLVRERPVHADVLRQRVLWVKRKTGHLPYQMDGQGLASFFCRPFGSAGFEREHVLPAFCNESLLLSFSQHMCSDVASTSRETHGQLEAGLREFCETILYECLTKEKPDMIPAYLHLYHLGHRLQKCGSATALHSLRLLATYAPSQLASAFVANENGKPEPPVQQPFLQSLCHHVDQLGARRQGWEKGISRETRGRRIAPSLAAVSASMRQSLAFDERTREARGGQGAG